MTSESRGRAVVIAPSALRSKDLPAGLSKVQLRESARRYIRRRGPVGGMWRRRIRGEVPDMTSPEFPEHGFQKRSPRLEDTKGLDIFPRRVGPVTWYPHHPPVMVVLELALHQMESGTSVPTHLVNIQTSSGDSLNA